MSQIPEPSTSGIDEQRTFTLPEVRRIVMFARLEGAPALAEDVIADLDARDRKTRDDAS